GGGGVGAAGWHASGAPARSAGAGRSESGGGWVGSAGRSGSGRMTTKTERHLGHLTARPSSGIRLSSIWYSAWQPSQEILIEPRGVPWVEDCAIVGDTPGPPEGNIRPGSRATPRPSLTESGPPPYTSKGMIPVARLCALLLLWE